ncbi:MAG: hypothetical protein ACUVTP_10075 [Candidatus Fervidibacter sp.]|uniref:hypothetical protein n=1 Tax=Candidatus Fervidibacter sp. TaxID=3100871 RepID=UPI00404B5EB9
MTLVFGLCMENIATIARSGINHLTFVFKKIAKMHHQSGSILLPSELERDPEACTLWVTVLLNLHQFVLLLVNQLNILREAGWDWKTLSAPIILLTISERGSGRISPA